MKSVNKFTKFIKTTQNSNNINVRRNFGSNESHANNCAPKKYAIANKFISKSKEPGGFAIRKNSKVGVLSSNYHHLKSTINTFTNMARYTPAVPSGSENVSITGEVSFANPPIRNFPLRDITNQVQ